MKSLIKAVAIAAILAAPVASFAQSSDQPVTRAEVRNQLIQLEQAGYNPATKQRPEISGRHSSRRKPRTGAKPGCRADAGTGREYQWLRWRGERFVAIGWRGPADVRPEVGLFR